MAGSPLSVLSTPMGPLGGGSQIPSITADAKSGASQDTSGSSYQLSSGTPGDLIVGGGKNNTWLILGLAAVAGFFLLRR